MRDKQENRRNYKKQENRTNTNIEQEKQNRIFENGFLKYSLSKEVQSALSVIKYRTPTQVQEQIIPHALKKEDIVCKSQTGSGKTAAFAIPICELVNWDENKPESIVLEPTRELTVQVKQEIFNIGRNKRVKVIDVFGGFPIDKQIQSLKQKCHIVVGTPGRMLDHIRRDSLKLDMVKCVVIDEADLMLDMGFLEDVIKIIEEIGHKVQLMLFSATIDNGLNRIIERYMTNPVEVQIEAEGQTVETIEQQCYFVDNERKYDAFKMLMIQSNPDKAMIFCGTKQMVDILCRKLARDGIRCGMIHGDIEQRDRIRTIDRFKEGAFRYLICTDVAARGIDIDQLSHVYNYDFPTGKETYVHRIGRTGRNGNAGKAISIVCEEDKRMFGMVQDYIGMKLELQDYNEDSVDQEEQFWLRQKEKPKRTPKKGADFNRTITRLSVGGGKKSKMRAVDIVGTICSIEGVASDDIGIIDVRDSLVYVDILNGKGKKVLDALQTKTVKGKVRKVRITKGEI